MGNRQSTAASPSSSSSSNDSIPPPASSSSVPADSSENHRQRGPSYFSMAKQGYGELVNAIVRPPRAEYEVENLGPEAFKFCGRVFTRTDFTLDTGEGRGGTDRLPKATEERDFFLGSRVAIRETFRERPLLLDSAGGI